MSSSPPPVAHDAAESERITQLKAALWLPVGRLVDAATLALAANATPRFIGALTELVWQQLEGAARDVEAFARHAGRTAVAPEDVLLLARRNDALRALLVEALEAERRRVEDEAAAESGAVGRGRGRGRGAVGRARGGGDAGRARGRARGRAGA